MKPIVRTERTTVVRRAKRANYDRATINAILDEALICHVGFVVDGQQYVLPTIHARVGDRLYLHGAITNRMLRTLRGDGLACVTVTLVDGLVLARSAFHHSINYRSVVILGAATEVSDNAEKVAALRAIVEHVMPGRMAETRAPSLQETIATAILRLPIEEASAKARSGPPLDDEEDYDLPYWAGVLPLTLRPLAPIPDPRLVKAMPVPCNVSMYSRQGRGSSS